MPIITNEIKFKKSLSLLLLAIGLWWFLSPPKTNSQRIIHYAFNTKERELQLYWKDPQGQIFGSIANLKNYLQKNNRQLTFAMNGGMFNSWQAPQGLYIENGKKLANIDVSDGEGNFYLKPNGVFYLLKDRSAAICKTEDFKENEQILYATQSGPMLLVNGAIHPAFKKGSSNLNIRNGVGVLPDGRVVFAISEGEINLYDFALHFQKLGCQNALYLDGFVSQMYLPSQNWLQTGGSFGVIMAVVE